MISNRPKVLEVNRRNIRFRKRRKIITFVEENGVFLRRANSQSGEFLNFPFLKRIFEKLPVGNVICQFKGRFVIKPCGFFRFLLPTQFLKESDRLSRSVGKGVLPFQGFDQSQIESETCLGRILIQLREPQAQIISREIAVAVFKKISQEIIGEILKLIPKKITVPENQMGLAFV